MKQTSATSERRNKIVIFISLLTICFLFYHISFESFDDVTPYSSQSGNLRTSTMAKHEAKMTFWKSLETCLVNSKPTNSAPHHFAVESGSVGEHGGEPTYLVNMPPQDVETMRLSHDSFVRCSQSLQLEKVYQAGSRGIVTTAGGKYVPLLLVSLRLLRKGGSNLPVEVFLADDSEYEPYFCDTLLPSLNAKCRVLSHVMGAQSDFKLKSYQYKIFSILFSSFEDVLFMDADNIALRDPNVLFDSKPFTSHGMVLWPDYWKSTASRQFYQIQGNSSHVMDPNHTCETGQMLVSKRLHRQSLLLSSYYNVYGPGYYYSILSQGSQGEGDKETFAGAALYYQNPYYLVKKMLGPLGFFDKDRHEEYRGTAMMQFDPKDDYEGVEAEHIRPMFIHANFPKFDPFTMIYMGVTSYADGSPHRVWVDVHKKHHQMSFGSDPELALFEEMMYISCEEGERFLSRHAEPAAHCERLRKHYQAVFSPPETPARLTDLKW